MTHDEYRTKYTTTLDWPEKANYTMYFVYRAGEVLFSGNVEEYHAVKDMLGANTVIERSVDDEAFKDARRAYAADQSRLTEQFRQDLFVEHNVVTNPKRDKCFSLAWDQGHSAGYGEVASYFDTFVDLIKD